MPARIAAASDSDDGPAIGSDRPQKKGSATSAPSTSPAAPTTIAEPSRFSAAALAASLPVALLSVLVIARLRPLLAQFPAVHGHREDDQQVDGDHDDRPPRL